jgi:hypothetical protein
MGLLELSLSSPTLAHAVVSHALAMASRDALPATGSELLAFARAYLVGPLTAAVGPRMTVALIDDLVDQLDPHPGAPDSGIRIHDSAPAPSARRPIARMDVRKSGTPPAAATLGIVVVDPDKVTRPALARALLRAKWSVTVVDSPAELAQAQGDGDDFSAALIALHHPLAHAIVRELVARYPSVAVIARCEGAHVAHEKLRDLSIAKLEVHSCDAPPETLVAIIRQTLGL